MSKLIAAVIVIIICGLAIQLRMQESRKHLNRDAIKRVGSPSYTLPNNLNPGGLVSPETVQVSGPVARHRAMSKNKQ